MAGAAWHGQASGSSLRAISLLARAARSVALAGVLCCALSIALPMSTGSAQSRLQSQSQAQAQAQAPTMDRRALACTGCHGEQGRAGPDGYYPRLAGKPAEYLLRQLRAFRDGERQYRPMQRLLHGLPDSYLRDFAEHFAAIDAPYPSPPPAEADRATLERGERLVYGTRAPGSEPACVDCHGASLLGDGVRAPGLKGLSRDYLNAQLGAWRTDQRRTRGSACMARVVNALAPGDVAAIPAWTAAQPVAAAAKPPADAGTHAAVRETVERLCADPSIPVTGEVHAGQASGTAQEGARAGTGDADVERGRYLARIGHCEGCHSRSGDARYAGGPPIETAFGTFFGPNLTPDPTHGIGGWSADDFHRAMHEGRSRDGRALYPAFPYRWFSAITREDSDALFAYLRSLKAVPRPREAHRLRFPANTSFALWLWRTLWFTPSTADAQAARRADRDPLERRGAYLGEVLGHCGACHSARNVFGAPYAANALDGAPSPGDPRDARWIAPSLRDPAQGAVSDWPIDAIVRWLRTGQLAHAVASGPMGDVIHGSLQYLTDADALALATWLKSLEPVNVEPARRHASMPASRASIALGEGVYEANCADCHGKDGRGSPDGDYPALAGNRQVVADDPANVVAIVRHGGFAPATGARPRPPGMPPFAQALDANALAGVIDYIRNSWGNVAPGVRSRDLD